MVLGDCFTYLWGLGSIQHYIGSILRFLAHLQAIRGRARVSLQPPDPKSLELYFGPSYNLIRGQRVFVVGLCKFTVVIPSQALNPNPLITTSSLYYKVPENNL